MSARINTNGQARKSLADQIDRLDGMLDGLSDGLNEAVAEAVKNAVSAAVQQAVQTVLREVLSNSELPARFQAAGPAEAESTPTPPSQTPKSGWKQRWAAVRNKLTAWAAAIRLECGRRLDQVRRCVAGVWDRVWYVSSWPYLFLTRVPYLLLTAVVGVTVGVAASLTRPWWKAAVRGVGWLAATAAIQIRTAWQRLTTLCVASIL